MITAVSEAVRSAFSRSQMPLASAVCTTSAGTPPWRSRTSLTRTSGTWSRISSTPATTHCAISQATAAPTTPICGTSTMTSPSTSTLSPTRMPTTAAIRRSHPGLADRQGDHRARERGERQQPQRRRAVLGVVGTEQAQPEGGEGHDERDHRREQRERVLDRPPVVDLKQFLVADAVRHQGLPERARHRVQGDAHRPGQRERGRSGGAGEVEHEQRHQRGAGDPGQRAHVVRPDEPAQVAQCHDLRLLVRMGADERGHRPAEQVDAASRRRRRPSRRSTTTRSRPGPPRRRPARRSARSSAPRRRCSRPAPRPGGRPPPARCPASRRSTTVSWPPRTRSRDTRAAAGRPGRRATTRSGRAGTRPPPRRTACRRPGRRGGSSGRPRRPRWARTAAARSSG